MVVVESDYKPVVVTEGDYKPVVVESHYKPMVIVTPQNLQDRKRRSAEHDDEDYVPELGADSDSDCSDANKQEYEQEDEDEEEEEYESEEEEGQLTEKSFAAEIVPISLTKNTSDASFIASSRQQREAPSFSIYLNDPNASSASSSFSPSFALPVCAVEPQAGNPSSSIVEASIVEAAAAAAGLSADDDPATPETSGATYYQLLTEEGGTTAYAIPVSAIDSTSSSSNNHVIIESSSSSTLSASALPPPLPLPPPTVLPQPFQNLINSEDYQRYKNVQLVLILPGRLVSFSNGFNCQYLTLGRARAIDIFCNPWSRGVLRVFNPTEHPLFRLLQFPVDDVLTDRTHGNELLQAVLSELARILASVYPGHRNAAAGKRQSLLHVCVQERGSG